MFASFHISLRNKILIPLLAFSIFASVVWVALAYYCFNSEIEHHAELQAKTFAHTLRFSAANVRTLDELQALIENLSDKPEVKVVAVAGKDLSEILASNERELKGNPFSKFPHDDLLQELAKAQSIHNDELNFKYQPQACVYDFTVRFRTRIVGNSHHVAVIRMHSDLIREASARSFYILIGWASIGFCILGWGCMTYVGKQILAPINHITDVVNNRANRTESKLCELDRADELGHLAKSLNKMLLTLDRSESELKASLVELEERRAHSEIQAKQLEERNRELVIAQQEAAAASRAKSDFLANMSHEIRTPMTAILGFTDLILDEGDITKAPARRVEFINTIRRNGNQLMELINDILDLSKIESGKLTVERIECKPLQIIDEVHELMLIRSQSKGLELRVEHEFPLPYTITTDPTRLRQILINLVGNAIKFTESGSVVVRVRMQNDHVLSVPEIFFDVIDTGIGMNSEQLEKLFAPFTQADTSTTRKFGGTGLGLSISKRMANVLGGDITVVSAPNQGSTFTLHIPLSENEAKNQVHKWIPAHIEASGAQTATQSMQNSATSTEPLKDFRILVAEDGPDNQRLIKHILHRAGADVEVVDNGQSAVERAIAESKGNRPFQIILMDMQMPILDGYQATRQLRMEEYSGPIVALTAHAMSSDRQKCLDSGCTDFATKPINKPELIQTILRNALPIAAAL